MNDTSLTQTCQYRSIFIDVSLMARDCTVEFQDKPSPYICCVCVCLMFVQILNVSFLRQKGAEPGASEAVTRPSSMASFLLSTGLLTRRRSFRKSRYSLRQQHSSHPPTSGRWTRPLLLPPSTVPDTGKEAPRGERWVWSRGGVVSEGRGVVLPLNLSNDVFRHKCSCFIP